MKIQGCCVASLLVPWLANLAPIRAFAEVPKPTRCQEIEAPAALGKPHLFLPSNLAHRMSPAAVVELARGAQKDAVVTCVELQPADPGAELGSIQAQPWWAVHVEKPIFVIVSGAHGSCKASHTMVFIADESESIVSAVGIDQKCTMQPTDLTRGR